MWVIRGVWNPPTIRRRGFSFVFLFFKVFEYLTVGDVSPAKDPQDSEDHDEDTFGAQTAVEIQSDEETKTDAADHGKAQLHNDGKILCPNPVFFIVENHFV